jgi:carbon monoxide dehydrogenase subunit G
VTMELTGESMVPAARERVWQALNDPAVLKACIAGCQELTRTSDTRFDAVVIARVGPVAPTFRGTVELSDIDPPNGYTLTGRGQGGAAGFASMTAQVTLQADGDAATLLRYSANAEVGGKLAAVGSRLIQGVARKTADDFFAAFARQFDPSQPAGPVADATAAPAARPLPEPAARVAAAAAPAGALAAPVPAWLVLFCSGLGIALGFCLGLLQR